MVIIFLDLDGTLIVEGNTGVERNRTVDLKRQMIEIIRKNSLPENLLDSLTSFNRASRLWNSIMDGLYKLDRNDKISLIRNELDVVLAKHEHDDHEISVLSGETIPLLEELSSCGYILIMLTNTSRFELEKVFSRYSLSKYFKWSITRDDVIKIKPDPEGIIKVLKKLDEDSFVLIDNLDYGVLAAKAAQELGYRGFSILVNRCKYSDTILKKLNPDAIVNSLLEIPELLKNTS